MSPPSLDPAPQSPAERLRFEALQDTLPSRYLEFRRDPKQPYTAVVIPSQSVDRKELEKIEGVAHYEERSLFNLMLLRHPRLHVVYVTSKRLNPLVVDYYLHQMRGVPSAHARRRLHLLDCDDASPRPLAQKVLERPRLLERIRASVGDPERAHLSVFNASALERTLAVQLGIPMNACDPALIALGSKTGSRQCFREAGVPMAPGREELADIDALVEGVAELWEECPEARRIVVKLNDSFSGEGNALLELEALADYAPGSGSSTARRRKIRDALPDLRFEAAGQHWPAYAEQFEQMGGVCELWIEGDGKRSPSAQLRINPIGEVQPVSTHDQVLGGASGQIFVGATFPAAAGYRSAIQAAGKRVGEVLGRKGVIGRFAVDFLVLPEADGWSLYAVEINLRQGGTTHPFNTLKFLTDGSYDEGRGEFLTTQGQARAYFATDNLRSDAYRGLLPFDLIDLLVLEGTHFRADETGVVFHLLGCLSEFGKLGCTVIAPTVDEAKALYDRTVHLLDETC